MSQSPSNVTPIKVLELHPLLIALIEMLPPDRYEVGPLGVLVFYHERDARP